MSKSTFIRYLFYLNHIGMDKVAKDFGMVRVKNDHIIKRDYGFYGQLLSLFLMCISLLIRIKIHEIEWEKNNWCVFLNFLVFC